mgnify:CR=1 FL=1|jgi:hypothetical protein
MFSEAYNRHDPVIICVDKLELAYNHLTDTIADPKLSFFDLSLLAPFSSICGINRQQNSRRDIVN